MIKVKKKSFSILLLITILLNSFTCYSKIHDDYYFMDMITEVFINEPYFKENDKEIEIASYSICKRDIKEKDIKKIAISINRLSKVLTIWAWNEEDNLYNIPYKSIKCSANLLKTPTGLFHPQEFIEGWHEMFGKNNYCKYLIRFKGHYLIHSPIFENENNNSLKVYTYNGIGKLDSNGCIRLTTGDAHFLFNYLDKDSPIFIFDSAYLGPIEVEEIEKIEKNQTWDPTDPDIK